jgi:hypothetical protein
MKTISPTLENMPEDPASSQSASGADPTPEGRARPASPELTGGAGFTYEDAMAAVYLVALLAEKPGRGLAGRIVKQVAVQQRPMGHPLDDLSIVAQGPDGTTMRATFQVKRAIIISDAQSNTDFRDTIQRAAETVRLRSFQVGRDRFGLITGSIADQAKRNFMELCEMARTSSTAAELSAKIDHGGVGATTRAQYADVRTILAATVSAELLDETVHQVLAHFVFMQCDGLEEGSETTNHAISDLMDVLSPDTRSRAAILWETLLPLTRRSQGRAATFDRTTLIAQLQGTFRFSGLPSLLPTLQRMREEAQLAVNAILQDIHSTTIPRPRFLQPIRNALARHRFVRLTGLPGTGKSAVLRTVIEEALAQHPHVFVIKNDRLEGTTWSQYAQHCGYQPVPLVDLLVEIAATATPTLFIDGLDRVPMAQRHIIRDILQTISGEPRCRPWRVLATVRDSGLETLTTWLPRPFMEGDITSIDIDGFDEDETAQLSRLLPSLQPLLYGPPAVREVVRRPFFASILSRRPLTGGSAPASEVELAAAWWDSGGVGIALTPPYARQKALRAWARALAQASGTRIPIGDVDPVTVDELTSDGVVRVDGHRNTVTFAHDIFFEWAMLHLLLAADLAWIDTIRDMGEPPLLGRVVELLAQDAFAAGAAWHRDLLRLEQTQNLRSQWLRSWFFGPFGLAAFPASSAEYTRAML